MIMEPEPPKMETHTLGPWRHLPITGAVVDQKGEAIKSIGINGPKEFYLNGTLIAAAPELLEDLERATITMETAHKALVDTGHAIVDCSCGLAVDIKVSRELISRAKGFSQ